MTESDLFRRVRVEAVTCLLLLPIAVLAGCGLPPTVDAGAPDAGYEDAGHGLADASWEACEEAEAALREAYAECGVPFGLDMGCDAYKGLGPGCVGFFEVTRDSAACSDGQVTWDYGTGCD